MYILSQTILTFSPLILAPILWTSFDVLGMFPATYIHKNKTQHMTIWIYTRILLTHCLSGRRIYLVDTVGRGSNSRYNFSCAVWDFLCLIYSIRHV